MNEHAPHLPDDLAAFEAELAAMRPAADRLSPEQIWFRAGCEAERRHRATCMGRQLPWFRSPIASLAAGIAVGLAIAWLGGLNRAATDRTSPISTLPIASHDTTDDSADDSRSAAIAESRSAAAAESIVRDATSRPRIAPGIAFDRSAFVPTEVPESAWMRRVLEAAGDRRLGTTSAPPGTTGIATPVSLPGAFEPLSPAERLRQQRRLVEQGLFDELL